jgi:phosphatidylglycerophosphate synthase
MSVEAIITAEPGEALVEVCGISVLERLLRQLQRIGVERVAVFAKDPDPIAAQIAPASWARADTNVTVQKLETPALTAHLNAPAARVLIVSCAVYDSRLLQALLDQKETSLLIDSKPPAHLRPLIGAVPLINSGFFCGAALVESRWLRTADESRGLVDNLIEAARAGAVHIVDVDDLPSYVTSMRRHIRPFWFPAPRQPQLRVAESLVLDAAQNGTLDLPAKLHAPIETWLVARLCRTDIRPMQITLFTACVSAVVALQFARGHLAIGATLALVVGVLDGLDGKQARVKVETTELGKREHVLDYVLELSWWTALAYHFTAVGEVPNAFALLLLLVAADLVDQLARRVVKRRVGRNLDDVAPFDRFVRLIGARRNIYVWIFAAGLLLRIPDKAFVVLCWWGALTAVVHVARAVWISWQRAGARTDRAAH